MKPYALLLATVAASLPAALSAAENRELAELRQQIEQMKRDYEQRIQGLEARLKKAEAAVKQALPAPVKTEAQESALDRAVREAFTPIPSEQPPTTTTEIGSGRLESAAVRLIDVSFNTLVAAGWSTEPNEVIEELQGGNHDPRRRGFTLQQGELGLKGAVDPYFTAESYIVFNDQEVELEEAFLTTTALPYGLQLEAGFFFTEFGRINPRHPHAWHWIDQQVINTRIFGAEGSRAAGFRLGWLMPAPWFSELHVGAQDPTNDTLVSFLGAGHVHGEEEGGEEEGVGGFAIDKQDIDKVSDLVYLARWVNAWDLSRTSSTQIGLSALHGPNTTGDRGDTWIYGADLVFKWRPENNFRGWPFVILETEAMSRDYDVDQANANFRVGETDNRLRDWGLYSQLLYGFRLRWAAGLRFEYASGSGTGEEVRNEDPLRADRYRISPLLVYHPTEFSRLRLQYNYDDADHLAEDAHSVWLGVEILYGAHAAHTY
ncbi:MAG TPA: hypothetical protein VHH94_04065 [Gammaproteobacteria bacterium]|nr:hypothetical protein [Gammaproteobacteria bacterium]